MEAVVTFSLLPEEHATRGITHRRDRLRHLVYYGLRDGEIRCLAPAEAG